MFRTQLIPGLSNRIPAIGIGLAGLGGLVTILMELLNRRKINYNKPSLNLTEPNMPQFTTTLLKRGSASYKLGKLIGSGESLK